MAPLRIAAATSESQAIHPIQEVSGQTLSLAGSGAILSRHARAEQFPARPVSLVVAGGPGSAPDVAARLLVQRLAERLGQNVVVENRPGAGGITAMQRLTRAAPDGHTLGLVTLSQMVFNSYLFASLPYDPQRDLIPVTKLVTGCMAIAAHPSLAADTPSQLASLLRAEPGKLFVGTPPVGSPAHVITMLLLRALGGSATVAPFTTGPDALQALLRNEVPLFIDSPAIMGSHRKSGSLKILAVTGGARVAALQDIPTMAEAGFPAGHAETWMGIVAPAGTSAAIVAQLGTEIAAVRAETEFKDRLSALGLTPTKGTADDFAAEPRADHQSWGPVIREAGVRIE